MHAAGSCALAAGLMYIECLYVQGPVPCTSSTICIIIAFIMYIFLQCAFHACFYFAMQHHSCGLWHWFCTSKGEKHLGRQHWSYRNFWVYIKFMFAQIGPCIGNYMVCFLAYVLEQGFPALARSQLCILLDILDEFYAGIVCNNCFVHYKEVFKAI